MAISSVSDVRLYRPGSRPVNHGRVSEGCGIVEPQPTRGGALQRGTLFALLAFVGLVAACSEPAAPERKPVAGSARDPAGQGAAPSDAGTDISLADLWDWEREANRLEARGFSASLISYERDPSYARSGNGLFRVLIANTELNRDIPRRAVDIELISFIEGALGATRGLSDTRSLVYVRGPSVGDYERWISMEYATEAGPSKLLGVAFLEGRNLALVATLAGQSRARLADTASLAQEVAFRLAMGEGLDLPPAARVRGT